MRLAPRSLAGRLLATAAVAIAVALLIASVAIGHVLGRFVTDGLDRQLDAQLGIVAQAVRPDGRIDHARLIDPPPFDRPGSGWAWQADGPAGTMRSASLAGRPLVVDAHPGPPGRDGGGVRPFEARSPDGWRVHGRAIVVPTAAGPVTIRAAAPRRMVERPLREATAPLLLSIALLGAALALAVLVQLRLGLRPLARVQAMLDEVRDGRRRHVAIAGPSELVSLVAALNALIDANEAGLARARLHVANLAHGLKTPLATLRLDLAAPGRDRDGRLARQVAALEAQVRHHLGRAAAADREGAPRPAVPLRPVVDDLVAALSRIHAERGVNATVRIADGLAVRCDPRDLDEALGNLLDNAWRHAVRAVSIKAAREGRTVRLVLADDGTTLDDDRLAGLRAGTVRHDEGGGGHGQGIRIARELIELSGGSLDFHRAAAGGLAATVTLPG